MFLHGRNPPSKVRVKPLSTAGLPGRSGPWEEEAMEAMGFRGAGDTGTKDATQRALAGPIVAALRAAA